MHAFTSSSDSSEGLVGSVACIKRITLWQASMSRWLDGSQAPSTTVNGKNKAAFICRSDAHPQSSPAGHAAMTLSHYMHQSKELPLLLPSSALCLGEFSYELAYLDASQRLCNCLQVCQCRHPEYPVRQGRHSSPRRSQCLGPFGPRYHGTNTRELTRRAYENAGQLANLPRHGAHRDIAIGIRDGSRGLPLDGVEDARSYGDNLPNAQLPWATPPRRRQAAAPLLRFATAASR